MYFGWLCFRRQKSTPQGLKAPGVCFSYPCPHISVIRHTKPEVGLQSGIKPEKKLRAKEFILLLLSSRYFSFAIFRPKIACQAPESPNPLKSNNIRVACKLRSNRYNEYIDQKQASPPGI